MAADFLKGLMGGSSFGSSFGVPSSYADFTGVQLGPDPAAQAIQSLLSRRMPQNGSGGNDRRNPGGGGGGQPKSSEAGRLINIAHRQVGDPYIWGDTGPNGFDCSGLVDFSLQKIGVHVPGRLTANGLQNWTHPVAKHQLSPGDLVFFNYGRLGAGQADHVGIYKGHGKMIAASSSAGHVQVQPVDWSAFIGGGAIPHL